MTTTTEFDPLHTAPRAGKAALAFIFSVVLLDVMGLAILMPVQAYIVRQYSDQALMVAMIPVLYAAAQFFAAPLLGKVSDRHGRRPVLLISILGSALGYFLFGMGGALWVLFLSRLIDGLRATSTAGPTMPTSAAADRAKNLGSWHGIGQASSPTLGGVLSRSADALPMPPPSFAQRVIGFFVLPGRCQRRADRPLRLAETPSSHLQMLRRPTLGGILLRSLFFVFNGNNIMPVFMIEISAQPGE
jgi:DHA1 family tetracycline resistance protein-like MFS transporter